MDKDLYKGFVATDDVVPVFGGVQLTEHALRQLAEALSSGTIPMFSNHDPRKPIQAEILVAEVRSTESGSNGVWIEVEVPTGAMDGMRGFSFGASVTAFTLGPEGAASVGLFADPSVGTDADIEEAAEALAAAGLRVEAGAYLQFALSPEAVVLLTVGLEVLVSVGASAIWDAIKGLVRPDRENEIRFHLDRPDGEKVTALIRTSDPAVAKVAIEELAPAVREAVRLSYESDGWKEISPSGDDPAS